MEINNLAPIVLFTYKRLDTLKLTIEALKANFLAKDSDLYIFSDGPKVENDKISVNNVRVYLKTISGFKSIQILESQNNKGLTKSIIEGVSSILESNNNLIVLEDDLITTTNFLLYMNQALNVYKDNKDVISICGYGLKIKKPLNYNSDVYLYGRSSSWGWAIWKEEWSSIDWEIKDWLLFKSNKELINKFNLNGSDLFSMLKSVKEGNGNSWAIRFAYNQFKQKKFSIMPFNSLVQNIGFGTQGTNTKNKYSRFKINKDTGTKNQFQMDENLLFSIEIQKSCYRYHSRLIRVYSRFRYFLGI
jgi:hypothetical protein